MLRSLTQTPRQVLIVTALYYACFIMLGLAAAALGPTLPFLAENTHSSLGVASILLAARSFGYFLGALFGARLYDYLPGHRLIAVLFLGVGLCLGLVPLIPVLWVLALCLLMTGVLQSTIDSGTNTLLVWLHRDKVAPFMNGLHFAFGVGAFLVPIVIAQASLWLGSPAWAFWFLAILVLPLAVLFWQSPSPPRLETRTSSGQTSLGYGWLVWAIAFFLFFYAGVELSFGNWIYSYALKLELADSITANYLTSAFWGFYTLGRLLTVPLAARLAPSSLLWLCLLAAGLSLLPMLMVPDSKLMIWLGSILLGLSIAAIFPAIISFAERHMTISGQVMGGFFTGMSLGATSIPWLVGQLFERVGPYIMLMAVTLSLGVSTLIFSFITWRIHKQTTQR